MKKKFFLKALQSVLVMALLFTVNHADGQTTSKERRLVRDSKEAKADFIKTDSDMSSLFANSYGWAIFPNVGKGGIGIGGAAGNGMVYERGTLVGKAKLTQVTVGFQLGGQVYREVIFFETEADLNRFRADKIEFSAQASAVAVTSGVSADMKYKEGVLIFTQQKGGLMYEASVGGQKFNFTGF
ncbi:MAG: hypothetical protein JNM19_12000 [Chitinophagaceae bacterium]|nr:hypothetical protein [Chitinophagaceae bacterium]